MTNTIAVKISVDSPTPITSCLDLGVSGDWIIGENVNTSELQTIELYDQQSNTVYTSPIQTIVPVKSNDKCNRFLIVFEKGKVTSRSQEYSQKGFEFPGHGVKLT
jgi:hypothetical protein